MEMNRKKHAFTLVELIVVIMVIGILSSSMMFALYGASQRANVQLANTEIVAINERIMAMWDSYRTRPIRLVTPSGSGPTVAERRNTRVMATARLNALRDLQRMELPERITDVADGPLRTPTTPVTTSGGLSVRKPTVSGRYWRFADDNAKWTPQSQRPESWICPHHSTQVPPKQKCIDHWTERFEGAECLWMIVKFNSDSTGEPSQFVLAENSIDKDGDGMPEISDPWGNPVEWLRWAPGYDGITPMVKDPALSPDPFNPLRIQQMPPGGEPRDFMLVPLVYSAGPDGEYEVNKIDGLAYKSLPVPCDPFFLPPAPDSQVGTTMDLDGNGELGFTDNITNHGIDTR